MVLKLLHLVLLQVGPHELAELLRILDRGGNLDRSSPVRVVETLGVEQLLKHPCLQVRVAVEHLVESGDSCADVALLGDQEELVVLGDELGVDNGPGVGVAEAVLAGGKELLGGLLVDHNIGEFDGAIDPVEGLFALGDLELLDHPDLAAGAPISEDDNLLWQGVVELEVLLSDGCHHIIQALKDLAIGLLQPRVRVKLGHILVHRCTESNPLHPPNILGCR